MTDLLIQKLKESKIKVTRVPANMTDLFQPLELKSMALRKPFSKRNLQNGIALQFLSS